ncbi:MAG: polysaccharide deacetylase, partial [Planctomycetes bacterium]|nr:polysaccharide deacetylase [Planctomycetota bacterium]
MSASTVQSHPAALTVDLEDYYHPELVRRHAKETERAPRVEASAAPLHDLLERHGARATFFV